MAKKREVAKNYSLKLLMEAQVSAYYEQENALRCSNSPSPTGFREAAGKWERELSTLRDVSLIESEGRDISLNS